ncbi:MAG: MFS transporter [Akkermansiaceae bacterium]|nr:MFS transporter [Armatimonadota bacterium]
MSHPDTPTEDSDGITLPNARLNFLMLVGDVACFVLGSAFLDAATALPALIGRLGGDLGLLGILGSIRQGAYYLPQLFVAHRLQNATRYLPILLAITFCGRIGYFLAGAAILAFGRTRPDLALMAFTAAYTLGWLGDGGGGVPWTALVGRTIPARRRGALFAATQTVSGIGKLGVGAIVALLLGGSVAKFPLADAFLVWGCAFFMAVSWVFLALIRENRPEARAADSPPPAPSLSLGAYLGSLPQRLRERPDFARLALVQILATASIATAPFLWGFVRTATPGGVPEGEAGKFLIAQTVGLLAFAPVWGFLSDRFGPKRTLGNLLGISLLWPLLAFAGKLTGGNVVLFYMAYFLLGGVVENWITITNYLLESVPENDQPTYIGLMNAVSLPALFLPLIAGQFAQSLGAGAALLFAVLLLATGLCVTQTLPDTRGG